MQHRQGFSPCFLRAFVPEPVLSLTKGGSIYCRIKVNHQFRSIEDTGFPLELVMSLPNGGNDIGCHAKDVRVY